MHYIFSYFTIYEKQSPLNYVIAKTLITLVFHDIFYFEEFDIAKLHDIPLANNTFINKKLFHNVTNRKMAIVSTLLTLDIYAA